jgi:radical SAM protein with 4Fe4S-binding SPASM domain
MSAAPMTPAPDEFPRVDPAHLAGFHTPWSQPGERHLELMLDTTNKCNLRCVMCHFAFPSAAAEPLQQWDTAFLARLERTVLPHVQHAQLSLGTEPLLWRHFPALLAACKRARVPVIDMYTNGLLLTRELARCIVATPMTRVQFSLEGVSQRGFDQVRVGGKFADFVARVELLIEMKALLGSDLPRLQFNLTMLRRNAHEVEDVVRLAGRLGIDYLDIRHVVVHEGLGVDEDSWLNDKAGYNALMKRVRALATELGVAIFVQPPDFDLGEGPDARGVAPVLDSSGPITTGHVSRGRQSEGPSCHAPWRHFFVRPDRSVVPCTFWYTQDRMGNLDQQSFEEIWNGRPYRRLRWELLSGHFGVNCAQCPLRGIGDVDDERAHRSNVGQKGLLSSDGTFVGHTDQSAR